MPEPDEVRIGRATDLGVRVERRSDIAQLIGASYPLDGLLLSEADLGPEVFRLASGLAGELFQTCVNLRLPVALVLPDMTAYGERFAELAREHTRHPDVRFVHSEAEGRAWLTARLARG
ncbi:DUF4180 domain-containing protein [Deinococcus sonorensis]|uniref:DUF4180 domain-containing protein n=2 Tax=Deinococcus sonorensis TaxID=309891 RepID=A0AAU7U9Z3_9DEIO